MSKDKTAKEVTMEVAEQMINIGIKHGIEATYSVLTETTHRLQELGQEGCQAMLATIGYKLLFETLMEMGLTCSHGMPVAECALCAQSEIGFKNWMD